MSQPPTEPDPDVDPDDDVPEVPKPEHPDLEEGRVAKIDDEAPTFDDGAGAGS